MDDTKLLLSFAVNNSAWITESVNSNLQQIRIWFFDNYLMLNPDKMKLMVLAAKECLQNYWTLNYPYYKKALTQLSQSKTLE